MNLKKIIIGSLILGSLNVFAYEPLNIPLMMEYIKKR